jgi:hypothetical protein
VSAFNVSRGVSGHDDETSVIDENATFIQYQKRAANQKVSLSVMMKDGFQFFNFNPESLHKHEARVHQKVKSAHCLTRIVQIAAIAVLIFFVILKAKDKEGRVRLESQTEEYIKDITVDFNFPLHNFMVMN